MVILQAPARLPETTTFLKNPEFGDARGLSASVSLKRAMNGTVYTTVKTTGDERLELSFENVTRQKALEIEDFYRLYAAEEIRLTTHNGDVYVGKFIEGIEITPVGRGEHCQFQIVFEGTKQ